ncbi:hypothetical protein IU448_23980 [Nocardia flavorosea]|uniref:hypothetical protein n=1 Tax=Nocardia flavorosea TaxID=53429 RepID=UPI0018961B55|nr:hypothetical protein [Nocardia flavorosea]MBF6352050.1 hypothetical protein [Nocardia flavorosea]
MRGLLSVARVVVCAAAVTMMIQPAAGHAEPPAIPDAGEARALLEELTVAEEGSASGYSREKFPHWHTVSGECTTRETVLQRDGTDVAVDAECRATAGTWYSSYDDKSVTAVSDINIDHVLSAPASGV